MADLLTDKIATYAPLEGENKFIDQHCVNTKSALIEITEDKLENILLKHLHKLTIKSSWLAPLSLFLSVLLANLTAKFVAKFGFPADVWAAVYLILIIGSGVWLITAFIKANKVKDECTLAWLMSLIKNAKPQYLR